MCTHGACGRPRHLKHYPGPWVYCIFLYIFISTIHMVDLVPGLGSLVYWICQIVWYSLFIAFHTANIHYFLYAWYSLVSLGARAWKPGVLLLYVYNDNSCTHTPICDIYIHIYIYLHMIDQSCWFSMCIMLLAQTVSKLVLFSVLYTHFTTIGSIHNS